MNEQETKSLLHFVKGLQRMFNKACDDYIKELMDKHKLTIPDRRINGEDRRNGLPMEH